MTRNANYQQRNGAALIVVLAIMAAMVAILTLITVQVVSQFLMAEQRHRQLQAEWLCRGGVELAAARLLNSAEPFAETNSKLVEDSKVSIKVEKNGEDVYTVHVEAVVGVEELPSVAREKTVRFRRTVSDGVVRLEAH